MRNKLILFLMLALFGSTSFLRADEVTIDFETGDFSQYAFVNDETYPWIISTDSEHGYVMQSSNGGISSSSSTIEATFDFPENGTVSFDALCMGEGTSSVWDKCIFKIDGAQQFAYGASISGWNPYSYFVPAGSHTFTWEYTKDSSVNPTGDYFMVDNIVFAYESGGATTTSTVIDFATGDFSQFPFVNDGTYPWTVEPSEVTYCMMSGNSGIGSSTSAIEATFEYPSDGTISFRFFSRGEGTDSNDWDNSRFYIDGEQKFRYGAHTDWENYITPVTAGTHTFKWEYKKDGSVNPTGDCFMVDDITFTYEGSGGGGTVPPFTPWVMGDPNVTMTTLELIAPEDGAMNVGNPVYLQWITDPNAYEYKVEFSSVYNPSGLDVLVDWTAIDETYPADPSYIDVTEYMVPNTHFFWRISIRNNVSELVSDLYGFTTTLAPPTDVVVTEEQIFTDESTVVKWKGSTPGGSGGGFTGELTVADGTQNSGYIPVYGLWMDAYTRSETVYPAEMLAEMNGGEISSLTYYISTAASGSWAPATFNVYLKEIDNPTLTTAYSTADGAEIVYTGAIDGTGNTMVINFTTPYTYNGGNLLVGFEQLTTGTYHSCYFYGMTSSGSSASGYNSSSASAATFNQQNFLPKTTFTCGGKGSKGEVQGYNVYYVNGDVAVKANETLITEKQYTLTNLPYNVDPGYDIHVTAVYSEGESNYDNGHAKVQVSGYGTITGTVTELISGAPIEGANITFNGKDEFNNTVSFHGTTGSNGTYTLENVKCGLYTGMASLEGYENAFAENVTLAYEATETVDFVMHEYYNPVFKVYAEEIDPSMAKVTWSMFDFVNPTPGGGGGGGGGGAASSFTEGFEGGLPTGWTVIDANNDGWTWCLTSAIPTTWTYYASMSLDWYRTGTNAICSGSYINGVGALTPDEYLVTPQVTLTSGSTFTFWAAATDASYPADHFGVFVSDNGTSDWTSVSEWTLTAKSNGTDGGRASRDGNGAKLGTWYQYTADLGAYAGQKYIAIRHFNCNDEYIMCVDDIELSASKNRSVQYFDVYRKAILKENGITDADSLLLADHYTDTLYADFDWNNCEPGLYQYGVSAVYPIPGGKGRANRGEFVIDFETGDFSQGDFDNTSAHPWVVVDDNGSKVMKSGNGGIASSTSLITLTYDIPSDGTMSFDANCMGEGTSTLWDKCTFLIDDEQQFQYGANNPGWQNHTYEITAGTHVFTWSYVKDGSVNPTGDYFMVDNITFSYEGAGDTNDDPITPITWSNVLPKDMGTLVTVTAIASTGSVEGATVTMTNLNENFNYNAEIDSTGAVVFEDFRKGEYKVTVALDGMQSDLTEAEFSIWNETTIEAHFTEIFAPVDNLVVSGTGFARWTDMLPAAAEVAERYIVNMNNTLQGETTNNFMQLNTEGLTVGETYQAKVAVIYTTGMSPWTTANFTYIGCDAVETQVDTMWYDPIPDESMDIVLHWNEGGATPPTPPTPPTPGNALFTEDFEGGLNGWSVLTINSDGGEWIHSDNNLGGYDYTSQAHGGTGFAMCYSFVDYVGAFNTDSYLITPQAYSIVNGTTLHFWADNANDSYPENFSVCITSAENPTSSADFTEVWTGGAKGRSNGAAVRHTDNRYDNWREHTIDLSAYAGQTVKIAFHDDNYDMYEIWIDDVELLAPEAKLGGVLSNAGVGFGNINTNFTDDGNWYYYDNGYNDDAIGLTSGGGFYWGILFPAGTYEGNKLTKIAYFDYSAHTGQIMIYQGGSSAPETLLHTQSYTVSGTSAYIEIEMSEPIELDESQSVWVVMHNISGQYVAAVDSGPGVANGSCISTDGSTWYNTISAASGGSLDGNWNLRAYIETGGGGAAGASTYVPGKFNILVDGEVVGATSEDTFTVTATDYDEHLYEVVYVDANYNISCPYGLVIRVPLTTVISNEIVSSVYPNPTRGDLHIQAADMVRVSVLNTLGQILFNQAVKGDEIILDMARYEAGVYMINITTKNGSAVKRVVVTK